MRPRLPWPPWIKRRLFKIPTKDPVTQYAKDVVSGKIPSGKLQRLACQRHLDDRERYDTLPRGLKEGQRKKWRSRTPYYWDPDFCDSKLGFFPQLVHWRGRFAGKPFDLLGWQTFVVGNLFGWFKRDDTYRFETAYVSVPKKQGKSTMLGAVALLRGFFDREQGSETYSIATTREQADIVWHEAAELAKRSTHPAIKRLKISATRPGGVHNIHDELTASKFQPLSADRDSGDGVNPYCLVADEVHRYKDAGLLNMLQDSMESRDNKLTVEITTAGWNRNSVCYEHDEYSQKILEGMVENNTWFAFICRADEEDRESWDDPLVWQRANPSWNKIIRQSATAKAAKEAAELPSKLNDFLRYRLNIWTEQSERAIDIDRWIASGQNSPSMAAVKGRPCFGGLDLATVQDLAAFALVFPDEDSVAAFLWLWCPEIGVLKRSKNDRAPYDQWVTKNLMKATDGDTINHNVIRVDILKILEFFELVALAYDPHNSGNLPHELADVLGEDKVVKFSQGFGNMAAPCKEIDRLYLDGKLKHGNNPALNWMANNAAWRVNEYGDRRFDREKASEKIDGMVALAMAIGAWLNHKEKEEEYEESIYDRENRGLTIF